jgi:hypothetical protein
MLSGVSEETVPPEEVVDGEPVAGTAVAAVAPAGAIEVSNRQAVALAATGFVAGVATVAVFGRRNGFLRRKRVKRGMIGEVVSSNSFLVDVHVLKR